MVSWLPSQALIKTVPEHCTSSNIFLLHLSSYFHTCVPSTEALASITLGTLSIASWLFAQLPQIYRNHTLKSTSGLSVFFLVEWCLGDFSNLLGAIFTKQAMWQVLLAGYYCTVDLVLVIQWFWYDYRQTSAREDTLSKEADNLDGGSGMEEITGRTLPANRRVIGHDPMSEIKVKGAGSKTATSMKTAPRITFRTPSSNPWNATIEDFSLHGQTSTTPPHVRASSSPMLSPKTALFLALSIAVCARASPLQIATVTDGYADGPIHPPAEVAGRIFSWLSTVLYLASRLPQLFKNFSRRSTAGLSPALFIAAFFGNLFYSTSIFTNPCAWYDFEPYGGGGWVGAEGNNKREWIGRAVPFFLGAAGVLFLDAAVFCQFLVYGEGKEVEVQVLVEDPKSRASRWRRVSGWMRGWVPSPARRIVRTAAEIQPLMNAVGDSSNNYGI